MNKKNTMMLIIFLFSILLINMQCVLSDSTTPEPTKTDINGIRQIIRDQLSGYTYSDLLLIKGGNLSLEENILMAFAQQLLPQLNNIQKEREEDITNISTITTQYEQLIFLGGTYSNTIVNQLQLSEDLEITEIYSCTPYLVSTGKITSSDTDVLIFSTTLEANLLTNKGPERSVLSSFMDKRIVPVIATIASISILQIVNLFGSTISEFFFDYTSEHLGERKKKKHQFQKEKISKKHLRYLKEFASILIAIIVFSLSLSWTWSINLNHFYSLFFINLIVVCLFYLIREGLRIHYSKKYELYTEHVFWPLGSVLTFFSTILGNTFSLASYTALENEEKEKRYSKMYYTIFKILFVITLLAYTVNIYLVSEMIQMFSVFTIMALFIDMTPIHPMDGYEVKKNDTKRWVALYIPVFIMYVIIMFSTLI